MRRPHGDEFPQQVFNDKLYEIYYRFLETEDEYFDYAPAKIPPQGRWRIYGIDLPDNDSAQRCTMRTLRGYCESRCGFFGESCRSDVAALCVGGSAEVRVWQGSAHSADLRRGAARSQSSLRPVHHRPVQLSLYAADEPDQPARGS